MPSTLPSNYQRQEYRRQTGLQREQLLAADNSAAAPTLKRGGQAFTKQGSTPRRQRINAASVLESAGGSPMELDDFAAPANLSTPVDARELERRLQEEVRTREERRIRAERVVSGGFSRKRKRESKSF